ALALSVSMSMLGALVGRSDALWAPPGTFYGAERSPGPQPGTRDTRGDRCGAVRIAAVGPGADLRARRLAPGEAWGSPEGGSPASRASSSMGRAADFQSAGCGFESHGAHRR